MRDQARNTGTPSRWRERNDDSTTGNGRTPADDSIREPTPVRRGGGREREIPDGLSDDLSSESMQFARTNGSQVNDPDGSLPSIGEELRELLATPSTRNGYLRPANSISSGEHTEALGHLNHPRTETVSQGNSSWRDSVEDVIAIPAYNEEGTIAAVVEEAREYADRVLVVDDGSDDETANRANEAGVSVLRHGYNRGYGAALKTAFEEATRLGATSLVTIDADGQHDPADVPALRETLATHDADVVIGSRFIGGTRTDISLLRRFGLEVINILTNASLGYVHPRNRIKDTQSGFRAYSGRAIRSLSDDKGLDTQMGASTDVLYHARKYGYSIEEVGTDISYDVENPSSQNAWTHGVALTTNIAKTVMYQHPLLSLAVPGFASILFGLWLGIQFVGNVIGSGIVLTALFVLAVAFGWAGLFASFVAALIFVVTTHGN